MTNSIRAVSVRLCLWIIFALATNSAAQTHAADPERPNILMILIDDMGWSDLGCFGGAAPTPHIDQLATEGLRFHSFYVNSPICSPSRTALTTGNYPARHRITSFLANRRENNERGMAQWLDPQVPTLAKMLKARGYATGHFGKWHMGGQRDVGDAPLITEYGFDSSLTNFEGLGPRVLPLNDAHDGQPPKRYSLGSENLGRGQITWVDRSVVTSKYVERAIEFIDSSAADGKPWMVNLWPDDVHSPFFPPTGQRGDERKRTLYQKVLTNMDHQLGVLIEHVRASPGLRENTIILLASDNGPEPGAGSSEPLRGAKGELWEGGIRSPLIVWAPKHMPERAWGTINRTSVVSSVDLARSLMALTGAELPNGYLPDGEECSSTLLGQQTTGRQAALMWRRPPDRPSQPRNRRPDLAIRNQQWKLVCDFDGGHPELYDLVQDAGEQHDVSTSHNEVVQRLTGEVMQWNKSLPSESPLAENQ